MHNSLPDCFLDTFAREKYFLENKQNPKWGTIAGKGGETREAHFLGCELLKISIHSRLLFPKFLFAI